MPFADFKEKLKDTDSPEHGALLRYVMGLVDASRKEMATHYTQWDEHDATFRSKRKVDKEDRAADSKGQPRKMVVPLTFSQCMTFVAFNVTTLMQNKRFYSLEPTGTEDNPLREPMELILERDLRKNTWQAFLVQFFLDIARFSLGVAEVCYAEEYRWMRVQKTEMVEGAFGEVAEETTNDFTPIPTFIGNRVVPISPYRWLPDVSLPLTRYQEGEYCGSEDIWSMSSLRGNDELFNLDKIPKFTKDEFTKRKANTRIVEMDVREEKGNGGVKDDPGGMVKKGPVTITKMVCDIIPKNFSVADSKTSPLGKEGFPVRYIVWIANDKTIVRFEEAYYLHGQFPYVAGQFLPDQHQVVNEGLSDICDQLTSLITWKLNAHVTSQKNSVESKWIVDPAGIDVKSLESRSPYIYLRKNASQTGVDRYIKQFATQDVTQNVMMDTAALKDLLEGVTGYNSLMQGNSTPGRRSATSDRANIQGATARGKTTLGGIWDTAFERLGKQLIANNRQEMEFETFVQILGPQWKTQLVNPETGMPFTLDEIYVLFKADPISIATSEDFFVFDASNPSENAFLAQSLQEILMTILSNPEVAGVLGYGAPQIQALFQEIYTLRGVTPGRLPAPTPMPMTPPGMPPNVQQMPDVMGAAANV
jgi:hypothetical protein